MKPQVLVIEDSKELAQAIQYNLELEGYGVRVASDGVDGLSAARGERPDLVILDLMLPRLDGFSVLERLRADGLESPVLILTARGEEADKVRGFRAGADQYMVKPFGLMELIERVRLLLRRWGGRSAAQRVTRLGDVEINTAAGTVTKGGGQVSLSPKAYDLLVALVRRRGAVASRVDLLREVWGYDSSVLTRTVDAHIAELRRKLEDSPASPKLVLTVWKRGYRLNVQL